MYKVQPVPDRYVRLNNGAEVRPLTTLKDEHGGVSHIIEDDHCYVLLNGIDKVCLDGTYRAEYVMVRHWYSEAVDALKKLPTPTPA